MGWLEEQILKICYNNNISIEDWEKHKRLIFDELCKVSDVKIQKRNQYIMDNMIDVKQIKD